MEGPSRLCGVLDSAFPGGTAPFSSGGGVVREAAFAVCEENEVVSEERGYRGGQN